MGFEHVAAGLDIGSTNMKALAMTRNGCVIGRATLPTPRRPQDGMIDASLLLEQAEHLLRTLCTDRYRIAAIATAGIGEDGMLVDCEFMPLAPALAWFDPRRRSIFDAFSPDLPPCPSSGIATDAFRTLTGWYWASRQNDRGAAHAWLALADYAAALWSGQFFISDTLAARSAAFMPRERRWCESRVVATLGDMALLPPVRHTGDVIGPVTNRNARNAGIFSRDALIIAGGHDHPVGGWGITQITPNAILDSMGTAEVIVTQTRIFPEDNPLEYDVAPGIQSDGATLLCVEELARNLAWASQEPETERVIKALFSGEIEPDHYLESNSFVPGAHGGHSPFFRPHGPKAPLSRGSAIVGALAGAGNAGVEKLVRHLGTEARVYMSGGWARAPGWVAIKRRLSTWNYEVVKEPELTAASAALMAARIIGWSPNAKELLMHNSLKP